MSCVIAKRCRGRDKGEKKRKTRVRKSRGRRGSGRQIVPDGNEPGYHFAYVLLTYYKWSSRAVVGRWMGRITANHPLRRGARGGDGCGERIYGSNSLAYLRKEAGVKGVAPRVGKHVTHFADHLASRQVVSGLERLSLVCRPAKEFIDLGPLVPPEPSTRTYLPAAMRSSRLERVALYDVPTSTRRQACWHSDQSPFPDVSSATRLHGVSGQIQSLATSMSMWSRSGPSSHRMGLLSPLRNFDMD
jgi:hypothetical protein